MIDKRTDLLRLTREGDLWYNGEKVERGLNPVIKSNDVGRPRLLQPGSRADTIVRWLLENEDEVSRPQKVQITFDCAGRTVAVEVKKRSRIEARQG